MNDNQIIQLILSVLAAGLTARGLASVPVIAEGQPIQHGVSSAPTLYYQKLFDHPYGTVSNQEILNNDKTGNNHVESQYYEISFQIRALAIQDPTNITLPTASDLVKAAAAILQSQTAITTFQANGVSILKIGDLQNPYFLDDKARFEASPTFDFTLLYEASFTTPADVINSMVPGIYRV